MKEKGATSLNDLVKSTPWEKLDKILKNTLETEWYTPDTMEDYEGAKEFVKMTVSISERSFLRSYLPCMLQNHS